jgi:hypothetical protein
MKLRISLVIMLKNYFSSGVDANGKNCHEDTEEIQKILCLRALYSK